MTKYYNIKTRAIVDSPFVISGENWKEYDKVLAEGESKPEDDEGVEDSSTEDTSTEDVEDDGLVSGDMTRDEIKAELDALGVSYDPKAKKDDLYNLMLGA